MTKAFLGLGANLGDRERTIEAALGELGQAGFHVLARSSLWLTEPVGGPAGQSWFVNAAAAGETALTPEDLLANALRIERDHGRVREVKDGPRTLDLDLLLYGDEVVDRPGLTLPHPRLHLRRFVLGPLAEIAPDLRHPVLGLTMAALLAACPDRSTARPLAGARV